MKARVVLLFALTLAACSGCHPVSPDPVTPPVVSDAGPPASCAGVCELATRKCDWGQNCLRACENAATTGFAAWDVACRERRLRVGDCDGADACER